MKKKVFRRFIGLVLAVLMVIEPAILPTLRAEESDSGDTYDAYFEITEVKDNFTFSGVPVTSEMTTKIPTPKAVVDYYFQINGKTEEEAAVKAWSEWTMDMAGAYSLLDENSSDAISFYEVVKNAKKFAGMPKKWNKKAKSIAKKAMWAAGFLNKFLNADDTVDGLTNAGKATRASKIVSNLTKFKNKVDAFQETGLGTFLNFMGLPSGFVKAGASAEDYSKSTTAFFKWLKKGEDTTDGALTNTQGAARCAGIALAVVGLALDTYKAVANNDHNETSYGDVKRTIDVVFDVLTIACMFIPVYGQIASAIVFAIKTVIDIVEKIFDEVGDLYKGWKQAYRNSSWYLQSEDEDFQSFLENRDSLDENEKSDTLLYAEKLAADGNVDINSLVLYPVSIDDDKEAKGQIDSEGNVTTDPGIVKTVARQGYLTSYYALQEYELGYYDLDFLEELWDAKQNYMAFKPTEEEAAERENEHGISGFFKKLGRAVNPMTYVKYGADKIASRKYNSLIKDENLKRVYFNPDYILIKKYRDYVTNNNLAGDNSSNPEFYKSIGLRIEMAPFNYLPLVGIEFGSHSEAMDDLLCEAMNCDAFITGEKELKVLASVIDCIAGDSKDKIKDVNKNIENIEKSVKIIAKYREQLARVAENYSSDDEVRFRELNTAWGKKLDIGIINPLNPNSGKAKPSEIVETYKKEIKDALFYLPLNVAYKAYGVLAALAMQKGMLDKHAIMQNYYDERKENYDDFDNDFSSRNKFGSYLKDGTYLNHKTKHGILDWFAHDYTVYKQTGISLEDLKDAIEKYEKKLKKFDDYQEVLDLINDELKEWKEVVDAFEEISGDTGIEVFAANGDVAAEIFNDCDYKLPYELKALDPKAELPETSTLGEDEN